MKKFLYFIFFLIVVGMVGVFIFQNWYNGAVNNPTNGTEEFEIVINEGDTLASKLEDFESKGLINSAFATQLYLRFNQLSPSIKVGDYVLKQGLSLADLISILEKGVFKPSVSVFIKEGQRLELVADVLETALAEDTQFNKSEFLTIVTTPDSTEFSAEIQTFLTEHKPAGKSLEGLLYPDTYFFEAGMNTKQIVEFILQNLMDKVDQAFDGEITTQNQSNFSSLYEAITLGSIIEKEASAWDDRAEISGVFHNRLTISMALQSDATVNYVTGKNDAGVLISDTLIDNPYNTYKYPGLPPGPINSPRIESIQAALKPNVTEYFFFYHTPNGQTFYSRTLQEHTNGVCRDLGC